MARKLTPKLCTHKSSGQAYVTDPRTKREVYLGPAGSPTAAEAYGVFCRDLEAWRRAGEGTVPAPPPPSRSRGVLTVARLCTLYLDHAERYYVKHGRPTSEVAAFRGLFVRLNRQAGKRPAAGYGPRDLAALRDAAANERLSRGTVNAMVKRLRRVWRWAVAQELLPAECLARLAAVPGLARGRSKAREPEPVRPVEWAVVEATLPYLHPRLRALVLFQLHGAMRPGEAVCCRPADVDCSREPWEYRPSVYKTEHVEGGGERVVYLGPRAREAVRERLERCRRPLAWCWPSRAPGRHGHYLEESYRMAVWRACRRANADRAANGLPPLPEWAPNRLRHTQATLVRAGASLDAAQQILGHSRPDTTLIYAMADQQQARDAAERFG